MRIASLIVASALLGHCAQAEPVLIEKMRRQVADNGSVDVLVALDASEEYRTLDLDGPGRGRQAMSRDEYNRHIHSRMQLLDDLKQRVREDLRGDDLVDGNRYSVLPVLHLRARSSDALERLVKHAKVMGIVANGRREKSLTESLPFISQPNAQASGRTGDGTSVCVLDTGADYTRTAFGACSTPGGACKVAYAQDFAPDDGALDADGHGTNVSATVLGVAPGTKVLALDVFDGAWASDSDIIGAIDWCVANKATYNVASLNMSLGSGRYTSPVAISPSDPWGVSIQEAMDAGIMVVAAAGNSRYLDSLDLPAAYQGVVSVGAVYDSDIGSQSYSACTDSTTAPDKVACFSNSASFLTMLAPGVAINAGGYVMSGTSMASPHVAGAAAVLHAAYPSESVAQLTERLRRGPLVTDARNSITTPRLDMMNMLDPSAAGGLGFTVVSLAVPQSDGQATLQVSRVGGAQGLVRVDYATLNGDAVAGTDYIATTGTLTWTDGDATQKTVQVPFVTAPSLTRNKAFSVRLSNQTGGATIISAQSTVTIQSTDAFPPSPMTGWTDITTSTSYWAQDTSQVYAGAQSMRSGVIGHLNHSGLRYNGVFNAGNIEFVFKVSSETNYDFLKFYVDGVETGSWSGEVAWTKVQYPVSAGSHELTWIYNKDVSVVSGYDAAWIDAVVLPVSVVVGSCGVASGVATSSAPDAATLCEVGTASVMSPAASAYNWTCAASGGSVACSAPRLYSVAALAGANGTVQPTTQLVSYNGSASLAIMPTPGFEPTFAGGCAALQQPMSYTFSPITQDCTLTVNFVPRDDRFPASVALPDDFTSPSVSGPGWSVVSDAAYAGTYSLRSGAISHNQQSDLVYQGKLKSGKVTFKVKTSSESAKDVLNFFIDGVLHRTWSGETDWQSVSIPVTAGEHALIWRYAKDASGTVGQDAAWLDSISLPVRSLVSPAEVLLLLE